MGAVRGNPATIAAIIIFLAVGPLFARYERTLTINFDEPVEAFAYGPLSGSLRQTLRAPSSYLSQFAVRIRAIGVPPEGYPLNFRLRTKEGNLVAEGRTLVYSRFGTVDYGVKFPPLADSAGRFYELEVQPAQGAVGDLYLPIQFVHSAGSAFVPAGGGARSDWSVIYRLYQTVRPLTFVRQVLAQDPVTGLGLIAAYILATALLAWIAGRLGDVPTFSRGPISTWSVGAAGSLAAAWGLWAAFPV